MEKFIKKVTFHDFVVSCSPYDFTLRDTGETIHCFLVLCNSCSFYSSSEYENGSSVTFQVDANNLKVIS